jgi:hypothetical protein
MYPAATATLNKCGTASSLQKSPPKPDISLNRAKNFVADLKIVMHQFNSGLAVTAKNSDEMNKYFGNDKDMGTLLKKILVGVEQGKNPAPLTDKEKKMLPNFEQTMKKVADQISTAQKNTGINAKGAKPSSF